jgi:hypothetical protein
MVGHLAGRAGGEVAKVDLPYAALVADVDDLLVRVRRRVRQEEARGAITPLPGGGMVMVAVMVAG